MELIAAQRCLYMGGSRTIYRNGCLGKTLRSDGQDLAKRVKPHLLDLLYLAALLRKEARARIRSFSYILPCLLLVYLPRPLDNSAGDHRAGIPFRRLRLFTSYR